MARILPCRGRAAAEHPLLRPSPGEWRDERENVEDLGLIRTRPQIRITNRVYREVIPRGRLATVQRVFDRNM